MSKKIRNVIFSESKNPTPRITQDWEGHWGFTHSPYSRPLLIADALTHYSWQLLIGPLEPLLINYCKNITVSKTFFRKEQTLSDAK